MKHTKKRLLSIFLIAMMLCSLIPAPAFAFQIQHNITAINSYRNLGINQSALSKNLEKLSSGYKINSVAADAAGLAISEAMKAEIQGLGVTESDVKWHAATPEGVSDLTGLLSDLGEDQTAEDAMLEYYTGYTGYVYPLNTGDASPERIIWAAFEAGGDTYITGAVQIILDDDVEGVEVLFNNENSGGDGEDSRTIIGLDFGEDVDFPAISAASGYELDLTEDRFQLTKEGYTFGGLFLDAECTQPAPDKVTVTEGLQLFAKWYIGESTVTENTDGSTTITTTNANGSTTEITQNPDNTVAAAATISETDGAALIANAQATGAVQVDFAVAGNVTAATVNLPQNVSDAVDAQGLQLYVSTPIGTATYQGVGDAVQLNNLKSADVATAGDVRSITLTKDNGQPKLIFTDGISKEILNVYGGAAVYVKGSNATDDAAGSKISESMKDTITGLDAAQKNAEDGIMLIQTAEGTLTEVHDMLNRMNTLAIQAANGTDDNVDRVALQKEVESLTAEIARIGSAGTFDAEKLLGINISTKQDARGAVGVIEDAIQQVSACRADFGAMQNRLEYNTNKLGIATEKIQAEENAVRDTDVADEMMAYTKNNILIQSAQAMLAQANEVPQGVLQLLQ